MQVLQAANTGITSLQSLVSSAQSIANQVLQTPVGYSTKSNVTSTAITGATANNLLGPGTNNTVTGTVVDNNLTTAAPITAATELVSATNSDTLATTPANGSSFTVDGKSITFSTGQTDVTTDTSGNVTIGVGAGSTLTVGDVLKRGRRHHRRYHGLHRQRGQARSQHGHDAEPGDCGWRHQRAGRPRTCGWNDRRDGSDASG